MNMLITKTPKNLYENLMLLCSVKVLNGVDMVDAFYFQDFDPAPGDEENTDKLRIFNYRMANYSQFSQEDALEARGIMFLVDENGKFKKLVCLPMPKFFNYRETPFTIYPDTEELLAHVEVMQTKEDGSLMSSYINPVLDELGIKSRGSIKSEQCIAAMAWLNANNTGEMFTDQIQELRKEIDAITRAGNTVNLEWCSPIHRIVLPYEHGHMRVLNVRNNTTGEYWTKDELRHPYPYICSNMADEHVVPMTLSDDFNELFDEVQKMTQIEGYIFKLSDEYAKAHPDKAQWFKAKTDWYCALHHSKDSVTNPRRLFECVMEEGTDDLRQMFTGRTPEETDQMALDLIEAAEVKYGAIYNSLVADVERFYEENKHLERKDYAVKGQAELPKKIGHFGLAMNLYAGKSVDYKQHLKKQWKNLGLKDEKVENE